jgi:hypothetical protein
MKPDTVTIPVTLTFTPDPADEALAELARHIVTRLTDEGALDEAVEHAHQAMAVSAAIEWATERLGSPVPAVPEPAPNAGASALYGPGETLEQLARTGELDRAAGLEFAETDISSALPFLPGLKPDDTVYLVDGFTESVRCPECEGSLNGGEPGYVYYGTPEPGSYPPCGACIDDRGIPSGRLSCPFPVDAPDHPCVQP